MIFLFTFSYFEEGGKAGGWAVCVSFLVDNKLNRINLLVGEMSKETPSGRVSFQIMKLHKLLCIIEKPRSLQQKYPQEMRTLSLFK